MKKIYLLIGFIAWLFALSAIANAPQKITYQGFLTDMDGTPINGAKNLTFKIYNVQTGGTPLWSEIHSTVAIVDGLFRVYLGEKNPLHLEFDEPYWLSIQIDSDDELQPRIALSSVPYSFFSINVADNSISSAKIKDGEVKTEDLADNSITVSKIVPEILSRIDGVGNDGGNIDLIAGANMTIIADDENNTITFEASGVDIPDGAVTTSKLADDAVNSQKIANGTITSEDIGADAVGTSQIALGAVGQSEIAAAAVTTAKLADNAVTTAKILPEIVSSLSGVKNDGGNIELVAGENITITPDDANNRITIAASGEVTVADGSITTAKLADDAVVSSKIKDGEVNTADLAANSVTSAKIADNAVGTNEIAAGAVGSAEIATAAVSTDKLADNAVTVSKIAPNVVSSLDGVSNDGGNIDLVAGENITITPDDVNNRITISSTGGGGMEGSGTANYIAKFTASSALGNSSLNEDGSGNMAVGTTASTYEKFTIHNTEAGDWVTNLGLWTPNTANGEHGAVINFGRSRSEGEAGHLSFVPASSADQAAVEFGLYGRNDLITLKGSGQVGIGTSTPESKLNVVLTNTIYGPAIRAETSNSGGETIRSHYGVYATAKDGAYNYGVYGYGTGGPETACGIYGFADLGYRNIGLYGKASGGSYSYGVYAEASGGGSVYGIWAKAPVQQESYAGYFEGDVRITGTLTEGMAATKIDHPLDPENKYLMHASVQSSDMMNIYNGNITLNEMGEAWVELPEWFEKLNKDFRYQLTAMGSPNPNVYIAEKISNGRFKIAGGVPNSEISWQVTGIRNDPVAQKYRIQVEVDKPASERGKYLYPDAYGLPETESIHFQLQNRRKER